MIDNWFANEISYIAPQHYVGTSFTAARLLNLDAKAGEQLHHVVIVPVDEFYVSTRDMGFEVVRLGVLMKQLPQGWSADRCDLQLKTAHTNIDGPLDDLILESKPLHDHLDEIYGNELGYAFNW